MVSAPFAAEPSNSLAEDSPAGDGRVASDSNTSNIIAQYASPTPQSPSGSNSVASPGTTSAPNVVSPPTQPPSAAPADPYANYRWKGLNINLPLPGNTVDGQLGRLRQQIADKYGIGYIGFSINTYYNNLMPHGRTINGQQAYVGQKPTFISQNLLGLTFDLSRYGVPDGQIVAVGYGQWTTWQPLGPNTINLGTLSYYQTLFNRRVELNFGILSTNTEFAGTYVGGTLQGGIFGPSASLFYENGFGGTPYPVPGFDVTGHITEHVYDKFGVMRASSANGLVFENQKNPTGLSTFATPDSGPLFINELGYLRPAAAGLPYTWVRGGALLDKSPFVELDHPAERSNNQYGLYVLADRQITQISSRPGQAHRGLYVGVSAEFAPPNYNKFSQYYEARLYGIGFLSSRPFDQADLVATETVFSDIAVQAARAAGRSAHGDSTALTLSYSARVTPGIYVNFGLQYANHPSPIIFTSNTGSALNIILGTSIFF
jgi:porin